MELLENDLIIEFTNLIRFFFNFNYLLFESSLFGELNGIFQDAFCSCFGFISPYLPGQEIFDYNFKNLWQLIGYNDYYLVNEDNPYLNESIVEKSRLISPIISSAYSKIKIIEKKTAVMLSKKQFGQYCTDFLNRYSIFLISQTKEIYYKQLDPQSKIKYPFQILYLNDCLQQFIEKTNLQISILEQNIPKKHTREHEIQSIKNLIDQIENSDQINQNKQKLENLKQLFNRKINNQKRDYQKNKMILKKIRLLEDSQIYQCKNNIIQQGLVINSFLYNKNYQVERDEIQQYLLNEASNTLASILNKIEKQDNQNEIDQSFENLKKQLEDQNQKYKEQFEKQFSTLRKQNSQKNQVYFEKKSQNQNEQSDLDDMEPKLQQQQSKEDGEYQEVDEKEDEVQNEAESILKSCDDILYAITILNMNNQRSVLRDLFKGYENNQLNQFTQMCLQFFESRNVFDRINIGLLSNQLILMFRQNINTLTQMNIFKIGLAEVYLLLNSLENVDKIKVSIPFGFENCFSFDFQTKQQKDSLSQMYIKVKTYSTDIDYRLIYLYINGILDLVGTFQLAINRQISIFNMILQILILFLKKQTEILYQKDFVKKIHSFLNYFTQRFGQLKNNKYRPFKNAEEYSDFSYNAYKEDDLNQKQYLYKLFSLKFHKTFLHLAEQAANSQTKDNQNNTIQYDIIEFIQSIRYAEIQHVLINFKNIQNISCELQIQKLEKQQEVISSSLIEEENQIKSQIIRIRNNLNANNNEDLTEQNYINIFYKQDFVMFISQVIYYNQPTICLFKQETQQQLELFEEKFLKAIIQVQKVRKIFLQELTNNKKRSSEKYIYIIQKLNSLMIDEKQFYRNMIQAQQNIENIQEFQNDVEKHSINYIDQMEKVYTNYLDYTSEPLDIIEKEKLDIQKFISEQINSLY
ncbi:hypothetical protein TTHERM_000827189 (macronuclear) [Tetrahymena thermophila SB210]|uniref:Uncharacterized protein n=1 Tax=Tetrahymena thermophila (strain SB210) TaxID=312017 RepID=W7XI03_TETTS|nr:hypothetical protein TTHERM_000827189 [Tetrahymena thermophila SB210]EWS74221.1 hypothetical protein TTHERM_000827189 [Tetrahymena thermophila SB210]|eukprot:XP_012653249.1 hypothetical protein TTHERM_000827189 [Tetrahymena thermophila SB210]